MKYFAPSQVALPRSAGILECWSVGKIVVERFLVALLHYSTTPLLQYPERVGFNERIEAEGDAPCSLASLREPAN